MMDDCPLVLIEWVDSAQPLGRWLLLSDYERQTAIHCQSVGWLIQDDELKAIAPNMGEVHDPDNIQASGIIRIPACAVTRMVRLTKGREFARVTVKHPKKTGRVTRAQARKAVKAARG